jgi:nucleoside-diphosphate-sugar epimerase
MNKALITGANGFVGQHLRKELEANGYEVFGIGRKQLDKPWYNVCDVTDAGALKDLIGDLKPNYIYHLAAISSIKLADTNPDEAKKTTLDGTRNLFEASLKLRDLPKIFIAGSSYIYGHPEYLPINEQHPLNGRGVYAEVRIAQEEFVKEYNDRLFIVVARSFNHTGPGQSDTFVLPKITKQIVEIADRTREFIELGNVDVKRDFTDVRDVVRAFRLLAEQKKGNFFVNVCRGESIALKDMVEHVRVLSGLDNLEIKINPKFVRKEDPADIYGDCSLLTKLTGWQPEITYKQMLSDMYKYWVNIISNS